VMQYWANLVLYWQHKPIYFYYQKSTRARPIFWLRSFFL